MTTPTGNRWVDQDTGKVANEDNIQTDLAGNMHKQKYGPLVTGEGAPPTPAEPTTPPTGQAGAPITTGDAGTVIGGLEGEVEVEGEDLPEIGRPQFGAAVEQPSTSDLGVAAAATEAIEKAKLEIRELNRQATKGDKATQRAATAALKQIAKDEYGRADGGRDPLKRILARYGFANPNK